MRRWNSSTLIQSKMISIKDIYQWDNYERPHPPWDLQLTPLQELEWQEQNSKAIKDYEDYKAKSFVGEFLMASPALIDLIEINRIAAHATYRGVNYRNERGPYVPRKSNVLEVKYEASYDRALYETVRLIHNHSTVELEGEIINFSAKYEVVFRNVHGDEFHERTYYIQLRLSGIKVTADRYVHYEGDANPSLPAELLDDKFKLRASSSKCFIATATFGNQEITEVIQLREFRDNILLNSSGGRVFITIYGLLSPPIAYLIKRSSWLRELARIFLRNVALPLTRQRTIQSKKMR